MGVKVREKVKGSGEYWVFIYHDTKQVTKKAGKKQAAEKVAAIIQGDLAAGKAPLPKKKSVPTLEDYYQGFKKTYLEMGVRPNTRDMYADSFARILPLLGTKSWIKSHERTLPN